MTKGVRPIHSRGGWEAQMSRKVFLGRMFCIAFGVTVVACAGCAVPQQFQYERHWVGTDDGWNLALRRFKPAELDPDRTPVVLCHGLGYNGYFWHLPGLPNFAHELQKQGYDVWVVDLRGAGNSTKPGFSIIRNVLRQPITDLPFRVPLVTFNPLQWDWSADDYIEHDLPRVIDYVRSVTDHDSINWVGHSLGAMAMFAYLGQNGERINAFASLAAPTMMPKPLDDGLKFIRDNAEMFKLFSAVVTEGVSSQVKLASGNTLETGLDWLFYNRDNMSYLALAGLFYYVVEDIPNGVLKQVIEMTRNGHFLSADGKTDYTAMLANVTRPILVAGGKADNLALPEVVRYTYNQVGSQDKTYRLFGTTNGYSADYGHDDLVMGRYAVREVLPYLSAWLAKRSTGTRRRPEAEPLPAPPGGLLKRFLKMPKSFRQPEGAVSPRDKTP